MLTMFRRVISQVTAIAKIWFHRILPIRRFREEVEDGERTQDAYKPSDDGRKGGRLGDRYPGPHIEEAGKVAVGFAKKRIVATVEGPAGGNLRIGHGAEQRQETANDPDGVDHAG